MREIKFRAWHKAKKFMDTAWLIDWEHGQVAHRSHNVSQLENCILMQYTGLKDKNGKEIYDGDVIRWSSEDEIGVVKYQDAAFYLETNVPDNIGHSSKFYSPWLRVIKHDLENELEVIGNIYENPELLAGESN